MNSATANPFPPSRYFKNEHPHCTKMKHEKAMNDCHVTTTKPNSKKARATLPAIFFNREGEPEMGSVPVIAPAFRSDPRPFRVQADISSVPTAFPLDAATASNRLRRALFETGQLCVTTADGLSRVCFAGVGDPERLFVEAVPREVPVPSLECEFPGCLCSLTQAEAILRRIYRGERSERVAEFLNQLAFGRRKRRVLVSERRMHAA